MVEKLHFPVIVKSSDESKHKFPTLYILNKEELSETLDKLEIKYPKIKANYPLIQEKISGKAYGFFAVYQDGECKKIFMHERVRENPVSGGASTCAKSVYDKDLLIAGKKILDILQWHGQAMVEFKKDEKDNTYKLIEINPKFWGSLELSLAAGMNFPEFLCQIAKGEKLSYSEEYKRNIIFQWIVSSNGELYRLLKKPSDIFLVLRDFFRFNSTSDIWFTDFKPVVIEFLYFIAYLKNIIFK